MVGVAPIEKAWFALGVTDPCPGVSDADTITTTKMTCPCFIDLRLSALWCTMAL